MQISRRFACVSALALVVSGVLKAQTRDKAATTTAANTELTTLASGWSALAAGRPDEAVKAADAVLTKKGGDHHAIALKVEALSAAQPLRALDAYEGWLTRARIEDIFLVAPIARGTLEQIAAGTDRGLQREALRRLGRGDAGPAAGAADAESTTSTPNDVQAAIAGNPAAANRLLQPSASAAVPPQMLAKAVTAAGPAAVPTLRALLKNPAAPVRMEAALSLSKLNATDAMPDLKVLMGDPEVRSFAAVALARMGDADAESVVQELLQSPVFDLRLLAAQAYEGKGSGPWVQALLPALQDPNGLTRIRAAELLAPVAPDAAKPILMAAAADPNPVVRADVTRVLERTGLLTPTLEASDPAAQRPEERITLNALRKLLRDPDPAVRLHAAGTIVDLIQGLR